MQTKDIQRLYLQSPKLNQLNILREVAGNTHITQAELASRCSLSVAMVNNYMKDLCNSDLLEYRRKSVKSVSYHLTPLGIRQLETLQGELIGEMVRLFAGAKKQLSAHIMDQASSVLQRVVLYGTGHLAQLAFHALELSGVRVIGVCDDNPELIGGDFCGREVVNPSQIRFIAPDAVIITDTPRTEEILGNLSSLLHHGIELIRLDNPLEAKKGSRAQADSEPTSYYDGANQGNAPFTDSLPSRSLS
jgi:predicted transcriptional regulator